MKTRIDVSLEVKDLAASTAFYSKVFGASPTRLKPRYANFRLDEPALHLSLQEVASPRGRVGEHEHFGVELFDRADLAAWQARAAAAELALRVEQGVTCCYAVADKVWLRDPDGNRWELWVRERDVDLPAVTTAGASTDACCAPASAAVAASVQASGCCTPETAGTPGCC